MIHHIVLFRFKPATPAGLVERAGQALVAMRGRIPEIRRIAWGPNLASNTGEYSHVLLVTMDDMAAVQRYLDHPVHLETVATHLAPIREARLAADIEVPE
jgi:hypothetical protein